jgi:hypothetical protein
MLVKILLHTNFSLTFLNLKEDLIYLILKLLTQLVLSPHIIDVISVIIGLLLGDGYLNILEYTWTYLNILE